MQEAAARLGYRPNAIARGLKTGRSGLVAMILPVDVNRSLQDFLFELLLGLSSAVAKNGSRFLLHAADEGADPIDAYQDLYRGAGVDGFIVIEPRHSDPRIRFLIDANVPHVVHGKDPDQDHPFVEVDNYGLAHRLTSALLDAGHRRIAFLNGPEGRAYSEARAGGFFDALAEANIRPEEAFHSQDVMTPRRGYEEFKALMALERRPTAFIAGNTMIASGLYEAAAKLGLRIPDDVSVLAHDDTLSKYPTSGFSPPLGGSRSSMPEAWSGLASVLAEQIEGKNRKSPGRYLDVDFKFDTGSMSAPAELS